MGHNENSTHVPMKCQGLHCESMSLTVIFTHFMKLVRIVGHFSSFERRILWIWWLASKILCSLKSWLSRYAAHTFALLPQIQMNASVQNFSLIMLIPKILRLLFYIKSVYFFSWDFNFSNGYLQYYYFSVFACVM